MEVIRRKFASRAGADKESMRRGIDAALKVKLWRISRNALRTLATVALMCWAQPGITQSAAYLEALSRMNAAPSDPEASFRFATIAAQENDFRGAIAALERILIINPQLDNIKLELGLLQLRAGSPGLGAELIRDAMRAPDIPPDVRARAQEFLDVAEAQAQPFSFQGSVVAGVGHDSNANSGPGEPFTIGNFILSPDSVGQADTSALLQVQGALRFDLGVQAGHKLALDGSYTGRRFTEQSGLNLDRFALSPGIDFNLSQIFGRRAELALRLDGARYWRGGADYLTELGGSAALRFVIDERSSAQMTGFILDQDFKATPGTPGETTRDGDLAGASLRFDRSFSDKVSGYFSLGYADKSANAAFERFDEVSVTAGMAVSVASPFSFIKDPWVLTLNGRVAQRGYDAPDPVINAAASRSDTSYGLTAGANIGLATNTSLALEIGHTRQQSNYPTNDFKNVSGSVRLTHRF